MVIATARSALCIVIAAFIVSACCSFPTIEAPEAGGIPQTPASKIASVITLPIVVKDGVRKLNDIVNDKVPYADYHALKCDEPQLKADPPSMEKLGCYRVVGDRLYLKYVVWRAPIETKLDDGTFIAKTRVYYWMQLLTHALGGYAHVIECGMDNGPRSMDISFKLSIDVDKQWNLAPRADFPGPTMNGDCTVSFLGLNGNGYISDLYKAKSKDAVEKIEETIQNAANIHKTVDDAWKTLRQPIPMKEGIWMRVQPDDAAISRIATIGPDLKMVAQLIAYPELVVGDRPAASGRDLPPPNQIKDSNGFLISSQGRLPFNAITDMLKAKLPWKMNAGGQEIEATDIKVYGTGDLVVVDLCLSEGINCHIYLTGKPVYDRGVPKITNFDFTAKTKNALLASANWILHEPLRAAVEMAINTLLADNYKIEREKAVSSAKDFRSYPLNDHATLAVNLTSADLIEQPYMTRDELILPFAIKGTAEIQIK